MDQGNEGGMSQDEQRGRLVARYRERRLWTREELAKRAKLSPTTITSVELGQTQVRLGTIRKLAGALGIDPFILVHPEKAYGRILDTLPEELPEDLREELAEEPESPRASTPVWPEVPEELGGEQGYLRSMFGSWARFIDDFNSRCGEQLDSLPEAPTSAELVSEPGWVNEVLATCSSILGALEGYRVMDILAPYVDAIAAGEPVSDDIRQEVIDLHNALVVMLTKLIPKARLRAARLNEMKTARLNEIAQVTRLGGELGARAEEAKRTVGEHKLKVIEGGRARAGRGEEREGTGQ